MSATQTQIAPPETFKKVKGKGFHFVLTVGQLPDGTWGFGFQGDWHTKAEQAGVRWGFQKTKPGFTTRAEAEAAANTGLKKEMLRLRLSKELAARQMELF